MSVQASQVIGNQIQTYPGLALGKRWEAGGEELGLPALEEVSLLPVLRPATS